MLGFVICFAVYIAVYEAVYLAVYVGVYLAAYLVGGGRSRTNNKWRACPGSCTNSSSRLLLLKVVADWLGWLAGMSGLTGWLAGLAGTVRRINYRFGWLSWAGCLGWLAGLAVCAWGGATD